MNSLHQRPYVANLLRQFYPILRFFVSEQSARRFAMRFVGYSLAWEFHAAEGRKRLQDDPTFTYTINSAERDVAGAQLARDAHAWEWCWTDAMNALAIYDYKGQLDDPLAEQARHLARLAEHEIDEGRLDEMKELHRKSVLEHNGSDELHFKNSLRPEQMRIWRGAIRAIPCPRIDDRPF